MASEKLLPCPFCGGEPWYAGFSVQCHKCGATVLADLEGIKKPTYADGWASVFPKWNNRNIALGDATDAVAVPAGVDQVRANIDLAIEEWKRQANDQTSHDLSKMSKDGWEAYLHGRIWNHFCTAMAYRENEIKAAAIRSMGEKS